MQKALVALAHELGAVSGCFEPDALCEALGLGNRPDLRREVLGDLSLDVTEVTCPAPDAPPRYGWMLSPDRRRAALRQLLTSAQVKQALDQAPPPWPDDAFGEMMHRILRTGHADIARPRSTDDDNRLLVLLRRNAALLDAVQFLRAVPALDRTTLEQQETEAKRQIQEIQKRRDLAIVLPRRHFGYDNVRRRLSHFLRGNTVDTRPVLLTGTGGIGKSAVLARLMQDWQSRKDAPITVILDFDRPQLKAGAPVPIAREILNQLATGVRRTITPATEGEEISRALREIRSSLTSIDTQGRQRDHGAQSQLLETMIPGWFQGEWARLLRDQPIALALDSFEAVDRQGGRVVTYILDVERQLQQQLSGLRTVLSGRAEPLTGKALDTRFGPPSRRITLTGLTVEAGADLLAEEDCRLSNEANPPVLTDADLRRQVSDLLNGHPLALLIFVQYARGHAGDIVGLVASLESDEGFRSEFAHRFLYERILERISDPELRKLAHPGLVLRQINTDLIRFVLAAPCLGLPEDVVPDQARAEALREKLENEYWLVEQGDPPFELRHRADVRRMMVAGLFAGPRDKDTAADRKRKEELRRDALAVCAAAQRYFLEGPPAAAGPEAQARWAAIDEGVRQVQALHYQAFLSPDAPPDFDDRVARALDLSLGEDLETLPPAWRARVKVLLGRALTSDEALDLSDEALMELAEKQEFSAASQHGLSTADEEFNTVSRASEERAAVPGVKAHEDVYRPDGSDWRSASRLSRDIQRAYAAARFDEVADLGPHYIEALQAQTSEEEQEDFNEAIQRGFWRHALWQFLLVAEAQKIPLDIEELGLLEVGLRPLVAAVAFGSVTPGLAERTGANPSRLAPFRSYIDSYRMAARSLDPWLGRVGHFEPSEAEGAIAPSPRALALAAGRLGSEHEFGSLFEAMPDLVGRLEKFWGQGEVGISDIAALYRQFGEDEDLARLLQSERLPQTDTAFRMFRGLNPDLYPPLRHILDDQEGEIIVRLAMAMSERARHWPRELRPAAMSGYSSRQSATLVEAADQCGELRTLCAFVAEFDPRAAVVAEMYDGLTDWFFPFARELAS